MFERRSFRHSKTPPLVIKAASANFFSAATISMDPQAPKPPAGGRLEASFTEQQVLLEELRGIRASFLAAEENFQSKLRAKLPLANVSFLSKGAPLTGQVPVLKEELELSHRVLILEQHPLNCVLMKVQLSLPLSGLPECAVGGRCKGVSHSSSSAASRPSATQGY